MEYVTLNNGIKMPMAGIGTFLLTPDEAEASVLSALAWRFSPLPYLAAVPAVSDSDPSPRL